MAVSSTSTEAELISEFWNNVFINELRENLQFEQFGLRHSNPGGSGTTVHWLSLGDLSAAAALTEGTDPNEFTLSAGDQTAAIKQYGKICAVVKSFLNSLTQPNLVLCNG